ncbi:MAG: hypothetical protein COB02_11760 [Candidatus Cloacimonadota bacterium]|nr:MAG: hypothetical protein COB02_11760 [Candidatus Cloacimonadota bacterium]
MRDVSQAIKDLIVSPSLGIFALVTLDFESGTEYWWTGNFELNYDSKVWKPAYSLGSISSYDETVSLQAKQLELTLSGIDPSYLLSITTDNNRDRKAKVQIGFASSDFQSIVGHIDWFVGYMDKVDQDDGPDYSTIKIIAEPKHKIFKKNKRRMMTHEDQKEIDPTDLGLEYVNELANQITLTWGD